MKLSKIALRNIRKSMKDYAIYFFTLVLGVAIFYVFNAIESQTVLMKMTESTTEIIKLMTNMLSGMSIFVSFVLGFLVIYASRFLMKRRNKEFGIYLTLGMSKRKISMLLFFETILIGVISLMVGLLIGIILSQFMSMLVASMFEADMTEFSFIFSSSACIKTFIYFSIMYLLVMIFNTFNVGRCKLIDLLQANKKSEKVKMKNPFICIIIFIISAIALGYAYYLVTGGVEKLDSDSSGKIFIPITLGLVCTFFIFWSLSGLILRLVMTIKGVYYKNLNSFTLRQISSKVNTTVFSMTVICIMLFITICVLSSSLSIKNSMTSNLKTLAPVDIEISKMLDRTKADKKEYGYNKEQIKDSKITVRETMERLDFNIDKHFKDVLEFNFYATKDIVIGDTLGDYFEKAKAQFGYLAYDSPESFIKLSDYNKAAALLGLEKLELNDNEYVVVADYSQWVSLRNEGLKQKTPIELLGKTYYPKYSECKDGFIYISSVHVNIGFFVVPDNAVDESIRQENILIANYKADTDDGKEKIENKVNKLAKHPYIENTTIGYDTKLSIYEASVGLGALVTFIGLYLGIIFLISCAAILALKELSESSDNKERFNMLRKIGTDEKMINKALFRQIGVFFLFPLIIAIIHSVFGIMFCNYMLVTLGNEQLLSSIIMTAVFLVVIYGGYFVITYLCSKNIIKES